MAKDSVRVLVVAPPGPWRDSLRVLLRASRRVDFIDQADSALSGQCLLNQNRPDLILLDAHLACAEVIEILGVINRAGAGRRCLVLTHSSFQERLVHDAGAEIILSDGFSTETFFKILDAMIQEK